jgi:hypothetical protein
MIAVAIHRITFRQASGILHDVKPRLQLFILGLEGGIYLFQTVGSLRKLGKSMKGSRCTHDRRVAGTFGLGDQRILSVFQVLTAYTK